MTPGQRFNIIYAPLVKEHLRAIERKYYPFIRNGIESLLQFEPDIETRNRKPLKRSSVFDGEWEIRLGPNNRFRVFYRVDRAHGEVYVLAIGEKKGNRLYIGGKEINL